MSKVILKGVEVNVLKQGRKKQAVYLLHGWGQNTSMMAFISEHLKKYFTVYNFDLPGFGESKEPKEAWSVEDYADMLFEFSTLKKIENPIMIGHSFGCRVSFVYAYKYGAYKMVLTGAAGLKEKHELSWYIKVYSYKIGKRILSLKPFQKYKEKLLKNAGSEDYKKTSGVMRGTFVKCVNYDCEPLLKDIQAETLLVFGEKDEATPLTMGKRIEAKMPNAALVIFENDDHYAYFHQSFRFCKVLDAFLKEDYE